MKYAILILALLAQFTHAQIITSGINPATQTALDARRTYNNADFNFIFEGDSIFQGVTSGGATAGNYLADIIVTRSFFTGRSTVTNYATAGNVIANIVSDYTTQTYTKRPSANGGKRAIYCLLIGTNDSTTSATQLTNAATLLSHCATAQADGFEVWLCTLLPRNSGTSNQWEPFNRALRDSNSYDKLIDFSQLFKDATNTALMGDNLHPTNLGYSLMADYLNGRAWSDQKRDPLNFGSMAKQDATGIVVTGGTLSGITSFTATGEISRTSTGASGATTTWQALGAGGSRQWSAGHQPNSTGNIPANGFGFTHYNGSAFEQNLCGFGPDGRLIGKSQTLPALTVATLPSGAVANTFATVNNASAFTAGSTVSGGGSVKCLVQYDGTNWKMVLQLY